MSVNVVTVLVTRLQPNYSANGLAHRRDASHASRRATAWPKARSRPRSIRRDRKGRIARAIRGARDERASSSVRLRLLRAKARHICACPLRQPRAGRRAAVRRRSNAAPAPYVMIGGAPRHQKGDSRSDAPGAPTCAEPMQKWVTGTTACHQAGRLNADDGEIERAIERERRFNMHSNAIETHRA